MPKMESAWQWASSNLLSQKNFAIGTGIKSRILEEHTLVVNQLIFARMNLIGERISWSKDGESTVIVISQQVESWKVTLLATWLIAWLFCGAYFVYSLFVEEARDSKIGLIVMLSFWAYFLVRTGKAYFWRKHGKELIRIWDGQITVKRDIRSYGKAEHYHAENIKELRVLERSARSFLAVANNSFWVVGGEMLEFSHLGKTVRMGCQLSLEDAKQLLRVIKNALVEEKKKISSQ